MAVRYSGAMVTPASQPPQEPQVDDQAPDKHLRFADSYGLVLVLLILSFFASAVAGDNHYGRLATLVLLAATPALARTGSTLRLRRPRPCVGPLAGGSGVVTRGRCCGASRDACGPPRSPTAVGLPAAAAALGHRP